MPKNVGLLLKTVKDSILSLPFTLLDTFCDRNLISVSLFLQKSISSIIMNELAQYSQNGYLLTKFAHL